MKLFNTIAAAAVIGTSFFSVTPVEAKYGWTKVAENQAGDSVYIKDISCGGPLCEYDFQLSRGNIVTHQVNCNTWKMRGRLTYKNEYNWSEWSTMSPSGVVSAAADYACNRR